MTGDDRRLGRPFNPSDHSSPAAKVMEEAIELAIEGHSPFPDRAAFIDADTPSTGHCIERAAEKGLAVVLVSVDGTARIFKPDARLAD